MKVLAIIGFIFAALSLVGGVILSATVELPWQGFSGVVAGVGAALMFALPSAALVGIARMLKSN